MVRRLRANPRAPGRYGLASRLSASGHGRWLGVAVLITSGLLVYGFTASLALLSVSAGDDAGIVTAGDLKVTLNSWYTWTLTAVGDGVTAPETLSGGPTSATTIPGLWQTDGTLDVDFTGTIHLAGQGLRAQVAVGLDAAGTICELAPAACSVTLLGVTTGGTAADPQNLGVGDYTYTVRLTIDGTDVAGFPRFGTDPDLALAQPVVLVQQVRP